jgi:hypothetical protein
MIDENGRDIIQDYHKRIGAEFITPLVPGQRKEGRCLSVNFSNSVRIRAFSAISAPYAAIQLLVENNIPGYIIANREI